LCFYVWLAQDDQRRTGLADEERFHGGERYGLIEGDHAALAIAGWK